MTWSLEDVLVGVITAPAKIANAARVIGKITRPPKMGSDVDTPIDADQAAHDKAVALGALQRFACRAPGPFDCLGCMVDDFTLKPCEYPRTSAATIETSAADSPADLATPPSGSAGHPDAEERICVVLAEHQFRWASHDSIGSDAHCSCGFRPRDPQSWRWHVAPLIAEKLGFGPSSFETGHDMGVSAASELFPQHTKK